MLKLSARVLEKSIATRPRAKRTERERRDVTCLKSPTRTSGLGGWAWTVESEKELKRSKEKLPYIGRFPAISRSRHTMGDYRDTTVTKVTRNVSVSRCAVNC